MFSKSTIRKLVADTLRRVSYLDMMVKNHVTILADLPDEKNVIFTSAKCTIANWRSAIEAAKSANVEAGSAFAGAFLSSHLRGSVETNKTSLRILTLASGIEPRQNETDDQLLERFAQTKDGQQVYADFLIKTQAEVEAEKAAIEAERQIAAKRAKLSSAAKSIGFMMDNMTQEKVEDFMNANFSEDERNILNEMLTAQPIA